MGVRSTPVLSQRHVKGPGHSAKSAGGSLHRNTHTPLIQPSRSGLTMLSRNSAPPPPVDHCPLSHLSHFPLADQCLNPSSSTMGNIVFRGVFNRKRMTTLMFRRRGLQRCYRISCYQEDIEPIKMDKGITEFSMCPPPQPPPPKKKKKVSRY